MKKISKRTRIKVKRTIANALDISYWDRYKLKKHLELNFGLELTYLTYRYAYFRPICEKKLMLFKINYSEHIL